MKAPNRQREVQLKFRVTSEERELIGQKMEQLGTTNMAAYLRKMSIDGYAVNLEIPELKELVSLLRYSGNNLNQLTFIANATGLIDEAAYYENVIHLRDSLRRIEQTVICTSYDS